MNETYYLYTFESTHGAISSHKLLKDHMNAIMMPVLREISASCGMAVRIPPESARKSMELMAARDDGIEYALYLVENGSVTPVELKNTDINKTEDIKMSEKYLGCTIPKLGFGLMRLPQKDGAIDIEQVKQMADHFMSKGFTYFDTAYVYGGGASEQAAKAAVVERFPRESFQLADKLPVINITKEEDMEEFVQTSLERTGAGYFDFYLLHALNAAKLEICDKFGAWDFMVKLKERGLAKHVGFSFHDKAEVLDKILTEHPEMEFVQLQINYADWDSDNVQSRLCYETARKHGKPVIIMEPVKGGGLVSMTEEVRNTFKAANPEASVASWAVRFAASLEGLVTVLSGMSDMEQMLDNTSFMENFKPLTDDERKVIGKVVDILHSIPTIPCTACRYCVDGCPMQIDIPAIFSAYNNYLVYNNLRGAKSSYAMATKDKGLASSCVHCLQCEAQCPQQINITEKLREIAAVLED